MKRFSEGLRDNFCEIIVLNLCHISCSSRCELLLEKPRGVTTCNRFTRALVAACPGSNIVSWKYICPEKKLIFLFIDFFLRRGSGLTAKID